MKRNHEEIQGWQTEHRCPHFFSVVLSYSLLCYNPFIILNLQWESVNSAQGSCTLFPHQEDNKWPGPQAPGWHARERPSSKQCKGKIAWDEVAPVGLGKMLALSQPSRHPISYSTVWAQVVPQLCWASALWVPRVQKVIGRNTSVAPVHLLRIFWSNQGNNLPQDHTTKTESKTFCWHSRITSCWHELIKKSL